MRVQKRREIAFAGLVVFVLIFGSGCDPKNTAAQTAVDQVADTMIVEGKTLFAPTDTPVPPTETPIPPTDTPVPTATEVQVGMVDDEQDCEVIEGSLGDDGCPIDLASFTAFPCQGPPQVSYVVDFGAFPEVATWDVCFTINSDYDADTGFNDEPAMGVDYVYCWGNEQKRIFFNRFGPGGEFLNEIPVSDPLDYVVTDADGNVRSDPFMMYFPPPDAPDLMLADPYEVYAEVHYYDVNTGIWVWDRAGPVDVPACPIQ